MVSTVLLWHGSFAINSLTHLFGGRRYATKDNSRNHWLLALITSGEGWHNNHHHYASSARQGFFWWEIDPTYWVLCLWEKLGLISDLRRPPADVLAGPLEVKKNWSPARFGGSAPPQPSSVAQNLSDRTLTVDHVEAPSCFISRVSADRRSARGRSGHGSGLDPARAGRGRVGDEGAVLHVEDPMHPIRDARIVGGHE
jgi:hypothetical protein